MTARPSEHASHRHDELPGQRLGAARGWAGVLLGPLAWALQHTAGFIVAHWFCGDGSGLLLHGVSALALAIAGIGLWAAWSRRQHVAAHASDADDDRAVRRARFVATLGASMSLLAVAGILVAWVPILVLEQCR